MHTQRTQILRHVTLIGLATVIADQATKLAAYRTASGQRSGAVIPVRNHDFSLGIAHASLPVMVALMVFGIAALGAYLLRLTIRGQVPAWATGLFLGGAISNLADRVASGSVRDFIATPWIILNLADVAVAAGITCWLLTHYYQTRMEVNQ